jgi:hypothetical protein
MYNLVLTHAIGSRSVIHMLSDRAAGAAPADALALLASMVSENAAIPQY